MDSSRPWGVVPMDSCAVWPGDVMRREANALPRNGDPLRNRWPGYDALASPRGPVQENSN